MSDALEDRQKDYKYGFVSPVETETFAKGLNEDVVRAISKKKNEPEFMLNFRLKAYKKWLTMKEPEWPNVHYPPIDFQNVSKAGKTSPWGLKQLERIKEHKPDLVMFAFGMNDAGKQNHQEKSDRYESSIRALIEGLRKDNPKTEFVLVANMLPNPEFKPWDGHFENRRRLLKIAGEQEGVVVADVMAMTEEMLKYKKFADISGNNLNHPNDFLHRLYAEVILGVLGY